MPKRRPFVVFLICFVLSAGIYLVFWRSTAIILTHDSGLIFIQKPNGSCALPFFRINTYSFSHGIPLCLNHPFDCITPNDPQFKGKVSFKDDSCRYRKVVRKDDFNLQYSDWSTPVNDIHWRDHEILEVRCSSILTASQYCAYRKMTYNAELAHKLLNKAKQPNYPMNVLAIGLDSMSRHTFNQQLSKSLNFFMTNMDGVQFYGHTIVGDGTTAALLAMLAGVFEDDVHETRRGFPAATSLDDLPFIWKLLHEYGYVTLHDETDPDLGTFQLRLLGFDRPPVHYYGRPFQMATSSGFGGHNYNPICFGNRSRFSEGLENLFTLFEQYSEQRKFGLFFDGLLTHSETPRAQMLDDELLSFLRRMASSGRLESTMVILFSDHGPRYGNLRQTIHGKYEERSPFLAISLPKSFMKSRPNLHKNLQSNADFTLTTPFDVHATFLDMLSGISITKRGQSLFTLLPANRTCTEAHIAPHWCPCANGEPIEVSSPLVDKALKTFLSVANGDWLQPAGDLCLPLKSAQASAANIVRPGGQMASFQQTIDGHGRIPSFRKDVASGSYFLVVSFRTEPGAGTWEATFDVDAYGQMSLLRSQVSRTNAYGHASDCLSTTYPHLRQYCVCDFSRVKNV